MNLYIVRHGLAGEHGDARYQDDSLRPLTKEGRKRFEQTVTLLAERGLAPSLIATSPLARCRQTAEILLEHTSCGIPLVELDELAPGSQLESLVEWTGSQAVESVAWVGHSPDVDEMTAALIGDSAAGIRFAKGAIACLVFNDAIALGRGELKWLVTAKVLGC
jgi:phosphohistidine phosphatase